jgi:peptidyl-prolyl cis-trans isomerase C
MAFNAKQGDSVKRLTTLFLVALASVPAFAEQTAPSATPSTSTSQPAAVTAAVDPVIITAGETQIRRSEFENALKTLPPNYQSEAMGAGKRQFAEDYLRMRLLADQAEKNGVANDAEVQSQIALMRENLLANAQLSRIEKGVTLSDADYQKAYDANKTSFEQAKARHILIAFKGSRAAQPGKKELTDAEAKAKAEEIRAKIVAGADFAEMAKKESDDTGSGARGGDLGSFGHNQMVPEFEKAVFAQKIGEVGTPVRTDYGYHIIQVQERKSPALADVKPQLEKDLKQKKVQEQLDAMKTAVHPTYDDTYFAPAPAAVGMKTAPGEMTPPTTAPRPKLPAKKQ